MDKSLFLKDRNKLLINNNSRIIDNNNQYTNLNLNQDHKCSILNVAQSHSKSKNDKNCYVSENCKEKGKLQSWNKSSKSFNFLIVKNDKEDSKKCCKNDGPSDANNSTLSLHISTYENSFGTVADSFNESESFNMEKSKSIVPDASTLVIQNPFEFPRQKEKDEAKNPEVAGFKASQKLLDPNQSPASNKPTNIIVGQDGIMITPEVQEIKNDLKGRFGALTNRFFRQFTQWPQPQIEPGKWREHRPQHEINQSTLVGDFHHPPENVDYRILGMRPKRTAGNLIEYEVSRLPKNSIQMRGFVPERIPADAVDYIMRLCTSENKDDQQRFVHGYQMFEKIRNKIAASNVRKHFPTVMGAGAFTKLFYKDINDDLGSRIHCVHFLNRPRPYYIYEKIGPTLDEIIRGSYYGFLDISTARHFAIGIIRTLRTLHSLEYVHRCVTSFTFSLRIYPGGFIDAGDLSNFIICNDLSFSTIYRSTKKPHLIEKKFYGTLKYSSPNAMKYYQQIPADDIISALYIFVELCHGRLAWKGEKDRNEIIRKKEEFLLHPTIMVDNIDPEYRIPIDIRDLTLIYKMLKDSNPYSGQLNYIYICEILHRIAEANKQPGAESYLNFTKLYDVENEFKKEMLRIQRGGQRSQPDTTVTTTVKQPAEQTTEGGKTKVLSKEKTKKSAENAKKKGSKEDNKKQSREVILKKGKTKLKSAEPIKENAKLKMQPKEVVKEKKKPKSGEDGKAPKAKSKEKQSSPPLDNTQPLATPPEVQTVKSTQSFE